MHDSQDRPALEKMDRAAFNEAVLPLIFDWYQALPNSSERFVFDVYDCQPLVDALWGNLSQGKPRKRV